MNQTTKVFLNRPLLTGICSLALLLPASCLFASLLLSVLFGCKKMYHHVAASFLRDAQHLLVIRPAGLILLGPLAAMLINAMSVFGLHLEQGSSGLCVRITYRRNTLSTAIALQSALLLLMVLAYLFIEYCRY